MNHNLIAVACVLALSLGGVASASLSPRQPALRCYDGAKAETIAAWARTEAGCIAIEGAYSEGCRDIAGRGARVLQASEVDPAQAAGSEAVCVATGRDPAALG